MWVGQRVLPAGLCAALILGLSLLGVGSGTATAAKWKQPTCGKFKKQIKTTQKQAKKAKTAAQKRRAQAGTKRARGGLTKCQDNRKAYAQIKNASYESVDDSGLFLFTVTETFCSTGRWSDSDEWRNTGWRVTNSRFKNEKNFSAVVEGFISHQKTMDGTPYMTLHRIALVREGDNWTRGTVSFDDLSTLANERPTTRKPACGAK